MLNCHVSRTHDILVWQSVKGAITMLVIHRVIKNSGSEVHLETAQPVRVAWINSGTDISLLLTTAQVQQPRKKGNEFLPAWPYTYPGVHPFIDCSVIHPELYNQNRFKMTNRLNICKKRLIAYKKTLFRASSLSTIPKHKNNRN